MGNIKNKALFTIVSKNYISFARTLLDSVIKYNEDIDLYLLLADDNDGYIDKSNEKYTLIESHELNIINYVKMAFKYSIIEFNTALKPFFIEYLFNRGYEKVIYLDPDIMVFGNLSFIYDLLDRHSVVLTPHLTRPLSSLEQCFPPERMFLLAGAFNLGFIGVSKRTDTNEIISWWARKCSTDCFIDSYQSGCFVDQKWCTLFPGFSNSVHVLRHLGCNMAVWNLHERKLNRFLVNETDPLIFYHFSGYNPYDRNSITKNQSYYTLSNRPDLIDIFNDYTDSVFNNGYAETKDWPYKYAYFANGEPITTIARQLFSNVADKYSDPFVTDNNSYYLLLNTRKILRTGGATLSKQVTSQKVSNQWYSSVFKLLFKLIFMLLGPSRYTSFMSYIQKASNIRNQEYLIK